jgi:hypothetical protein
VAVSPMNCIVWTGENSSEAAFPIVMFVQSLIHSAAGRNPPNRQTGVYRGP